jgi:YD repeat-containing protein
VFRTIVIGLVLALACGCLFSSGAAAQSTNCYSIQWWACHWFDQGGCGTPPGQLTNCVSVLSWGVICQIQTDKCAVPPSPCTTCQTGQAAAGTPINLSSGNTYFQETDIRLSGLGGGLTLTRTWNSIVPSAENQSGMFGLHWISTYEERVFLGTGEATGYMAYERADGSLWYFPSGGGALASPANQSAQLSGNGTTWTITFKDGSKKLFSYTSGSLTSIIDRNGNTTSLTYDGTNRLTTVTDAASRHLYFSYQSGSSLLVTGVTSDFGVSTSYSYDSQGRLTQVTEPDQSTLSFQYNSQSLISAVLDSNGVVLESHTYDSMGRGLTTSRANGVDAVSVSYPQ